jgi:hypothetical protein
MPQDACSVRLGIALAALGTVVAYVIALVTVMFLA